MNRLPASDRHPAMPAPGLRARTTASPRRPHALRRNRGVTLIELLVAMTIGMLVVLLCVSAYLTMSRTAVGQDELSRVEQNGRFALDQVARVVRMAGYRDWNEGGGVPPAPASASIFGSDGAGTAADTLVVRYHGAAPAAVGGTAATVLDCVGAGVDGGVRAEGTLTVAVAGGAPGRLICSPRTGAAAETLATGVEQLQLLYGIDSLDAAGATRPDEQVDRFVPASAVTDWGQVVAIRVALVVAGGPGSAPAGNDGATYALFGDTYTNASDAGATYTPPAALRDRVRRVFTQTIRLRNPAGVALP